MNLLPKLVDLRGSVNTGLQPDLHPQVSLVWAAGENVRFTPSGVRKVEGWVKDYSHLIATGNTTPPRGCGSRIDGATEEFHFGNDTKLFDWDGTTFTVDAATFTGVDKLWSFTPWGTWLLASNGVDAVQIHKGSAWAALTGTPPTTAEILVTNGAHVLAFGTDAYPKGYEWCHEDDVEDWVPTATNAAGNLEIREFNTEVTAAVPLGDAIAVYSGGRMAVVSYLGAPLYYGHQVPFKEGVAVYNKKSVVAVADLNFGLGSNGFFQTDGVTITPLGVGEILDYFRADLNTAQVDKINAYHNSRTKQIVWHYPSGTATECDAAITYSYETSTFSFSSEGRSAGMESVSDSGSSIFGVPLTLRVGTDGVQAFSVVSENTGVDADVLAAEAYIESKPYAFTNADGLSLEDVLKYIEAVKLYMGKFVSNAIRVKLGVQESLEDEIYYTDTVQLDDPTTPVFQEISGRWIRLRIESSAIGDEWELQGFAIHGKLVGGPQG